MIKKALIATTVSGFVPQFEMSNVKILQEMGYEVHYASNFENVSYGSDNRRLEGTGIICHQIDFVRSPFQIRENKKAYWQLKKLMQEEKFSLLHCHTPVASVLSRLSASSYQNKTLKAKRMKEKQVLNAYQQVDLKVVYTAHGFHFYKGAPWKYWLLFYPVERWCANVTDVLITMNQEDYERAKRFCKRKKTIIVKLRYNEDSL